MVCAVLAGLAWLARRIDVAALRDALAAAPLWPIVVAAAINFGIIACKAIAWRILLGDEYRVGVPRLFRYTLVSCAASVVLPLRAGELIRLWLLRDRDGVPLAYGATVALTEKLLDIVSMLVVVAPLPLLVGGMPAVATWWIAGLAVAAVTAVIAGRGLGPRLGTSGWRGDIARGLALVREPDRFVLGVGILLISWLIDLAMIGLVLFATGIPFSAGTGLVVLLAINLAIAIPSTPGQIGALELGAVLGLRLVNAPETASVAFAVLYHALQVVPITLAGLIVGAPEIWKPRSQ